MTLFILLLFLFQFMMSLCIVTVLLDISLSLLKDFIYLFLEKRREEKERKKNINVWLPLAHPLLNTWSVTQAYTLTRSRTGDPLVYRLAVHWAIPARVHYLFCELNNPLEESSFLFNHSYFSWQMKAHVPVLHPVNWCLCIYWGWGRDPQRKSLMLYPGLKNLT